MPEPLEYWDGRTPASTSPEALARVPAAAVPLACDTLLTETRDHPAARAIVEALTHEQILVHESSNGDAIHRTALLHVRASDAERAKLIAGEIFARRKKFKSYAKVEPLPSGPGVSAKMPELG